MLQLEYFFMTLFGFGTDFVILPLKLQMMENQKKQLEPLINWTSLKSYKDEATYNKIRRHLTDINDTITEQDIRDIKLFAFANDAEINVPKNQIKKTVH